MRPISGVKTAPPMSPITISEAPTFVFSPKFLIPSANVVGNIKDMKKLVENNAHTPTHPGNNTPMITRPQLISANMPISTLGRIMRIRYVEVNLPIPKAMRVPVNK
jgi:hypothetical protein